MNKELEELILEYEAVSASRDMAAEQAIKIFEAHVDKVWSQHPSIPRENLRKSVIKAHRKWALKQDAKPASIPPNT
jgi:hypothetical protein